METDYNTNMVNEPYKNTRSINLWTSKWKSLKRCSFHIKMNPCRGDIRSGLRWPAETRYEWFIFSARWKSQFLPLMCRPHTGVEFTATQGRPPLHCITFCLLTRLHCLDYLSDWVKIPQWSFSKNRSTHSAHIRLVLSKQEKSLSIHVFRIPETSQVLPKLRFLCLCVSKTSKKSKKRKLTWTTLHWMFKEVNSGSQPGGLKVIVQIV